MRQREPRLYDRGFLDFLKLKPCCICGAPPPSDPAHIRIGLFAKGMKPHDRHATPLCRTCHDRQHSQNEALFWQSYGLDPFAIAAALYQEYGGTGGKPRKRTTTKPRRPKEQRTKIKGRTIWAKRQFIKRK